MCEIWSRISLNERLSVIMNINILLQSLFDCIDNWFYYQQFIYWITAEQKKDISIKSS